MSLRMGQVVVTEGNRQSRLSRAIAWATHSWATHAFISLGGNVGVEAVFPRVRRIDADARLAHLRSSDRSYVVLDLPAMTLSQRFQVGLTANELVGRFYDVGQMLLYGLTRRFWNDGFGTVVCSRAITASYLSGARLDLFPEEVLAAKYPANSPHLDNLRAGYALPVDLLKCRLEVVEFQPSSRIHSLNDFLTA